MPLPAEKRNNGTRIHFCQEGKNKEGAPSPNIYLLFGKTSVGYCTPIEPEIQTRKGVGNNTRFIIRFKTFTYTSFNWIHDSFYVNGVKIVPRIIADYLSPLALAIWIMDDGSKVGSVLKICTNSFTYDDCVFLCMVLQQKYGRT